MLTLIDANGLACVRKKGNFKLLLEYVKVSNYGSYSCYKKLHDHLRVRFPKKSFASFSFKQKSELHESRLFGRDQLS